jgi:hypothetical protein
MKQTVYLSDFRDAFQRADRGDQFSYEALGLIYEYIEEYEQSTGEEVELDVIGLCCEWAEDTPENIARSYDIDISGMEEEEIMSEVLGFLRDETQVAGITDNSSIVYAQF